MLRDARGDAVPHAEGETELLADALTLTLDDSEMLADTDGDRVGEIEEQPLPLKDVLADAKGDCESVALTHAETETEGDADTLALKLGDTDEHELPDGVTLGDKELVLLALSRLVELPDAHRLALVEGERDMRGLLDGDGVRLTHALTEIELHAVSVIDCNPVTDTVTDGDCDVLPMRLTLEQRVIDTVPHNDALTLSDVVSDAEPLTDSDAVPHTLAHDDADTLELTDAELLTDGVDDALSHKDGETLGDIVALTLPDGERELEGDARPEGVVNCDGETLGDGDDDA